MSSRIVVELTVAEALIALGPIQDKALDAQRLAAISTGEEYEIAQVAGRTLGSVAGKIAHALYPDDIPAPSLFQQMRREDDLEAIGLI